MKYPGASQLMFGGMAVVLLTASGCSSMKWFHSGSDDTSVSDSGRSGGGFAAGEGARDGKYPSIGRQDGMAETEGGALRGFSPLVNGQIAGEERLSRSNLGTMLMPVDRDEKWYAEIRREEVAAM